MKKFFLLSFLIFNIKINAQFLLTVKGDSFSVIPSDSLSINNSEFLISTIHQKPCLKSIPILYKTRNNKIIDSLLLPNIEGSFYYLISIDDYKYVCGGITKLQDSTNFFNTYLLIDTSLNVLKKKSHPINVEPGCFYKIILNGNKIITIISGQLENTFKSYAIIMDTAFNNVFTHNLYSGPIGFLEDICYFKNSYITTSYGGLIYQHIHNASGYITFDTNFNVINADTISFLKCCLINISNQFYLIQERFNKTYVSIRDSNFKLLKFVNLMPNTEKINKLAANRTIINYNNYLYCLTTFDFQEEGFPCPAAPSYILVTKLDTSLNIIWQKIIGGDKNYISTSINVTNDGGCVVVGNMYDYSDTTIKRRDMFVLLLDSSGNIVNSTPLNNFNNHKYLIYPNPFYDELNIVFEKAYNNVILTIYNANGTTCFKDSFKKSANLNINLSYLKKGLYFFTLFIEDENTFYSGKIIKN